MYYKCMFSSSSKINSLDEEASTKKPSLSQQDDGEV